VTSTTTISAYEAMGVPEVWVYRDRKLKIYILENGSYREVAVSPTLPDLPLLDLMPRLVQQAIDLGTSPMLRQLRTQLNS
jgi:Uma2 family endonuclease